MMKRIILGLTLAGLVVASACKKTDTNPAGAGSWTLSGDSTYHAVTCTASAGNLVAATVSGATASDLIVGFYPALPTTSGTYIVTNNDSMNSATNKVQIGTTVGGISGNSYLSDGTGSNQTVQVTVANGKITVTGSGIHVSNNGGSSVLSLNITQTN